jgi:hypothetical protein
MDGPTYASSTLIPLSFTCARCRELLDLYRDTVFEHRRCTARLAGALGDDLKRLMDLSEVLFSECRRTQHALTQHCQEDHLTAP